MLRLYGEPFNIDLLTHPLWVGIPNTSNHIVRLLVWHYGIQ